MNSQTLSSPQIIAPAGRLAPSNLLEWKRSGSGTQWEKFRDSGTLDPGVYFVDSPFERWRVHITGLVALAAVAIGWVIAWPLHHPSRIVTATGEQRSLTLADGSVLRLGSNSDARIAFSSGDRRVVLARGEARFTVVPESGRPFLVSTPQATVKAVATRFDVRAARGETTVLVIEGRVLLLPPLIDESAIPPSPRMLSVGERASVTRFGDIRVRREESVALGE